MLHKKFYLIIIIEHRLYYWKISCIIGRPIVVLEDGLYYWKSTVLLEDLLRCWKMNGRSKVLLENQLYWRQSTGLDGNYWSRKITTRRWLHKYVGAECGASSFTWYLYQMCNTDIRNLKYPPLTCTWVRWSIWPTVTVLRHVRRSVCLSVCPERNGRNSLKYNNLMYLDHLQNWLVYGHGLLIFLILALFWLSETGPIWGFQAFPREHI